MARNNGIAPSALTGQIGKVIFYTSNGLNLVRSAPAKIKKSNTIASQLTRNKFAKACYFAKLIQPYIPNISINTVVGQNKFSSIVGQFYKMIDSTFKFHYSWNTSFTFGNNTIPIIDFNDVACYGAHRCYIKWTGITIPIGWTKASTKVDLIVFNEDLTIFWYQNTARPYNALSIDTRLPDFILPTTRVFIMAIAYDTGITPRPFTKVGTLYPFFPLTVTP